jgi:DNA-binding NarL/FixJ family response regulator
VEESWTRVLVVDDSPLWCSFFSAKFEKQPKLQVIGQVPDGLEAIQKAEELQPDLILIDIGLPTLNGIEAARRMRRLCPTSRILFVSENRSPDVIEAALSTGADGYVVKSDAERELLPAVDSVLQGKRFVSRGVVECGLVARSTQHASDKTQTTGNQSLSWDDARGIFRVDMDEPMPVDLPEEEQVQRILGGSYIADANDDQARMYGLDSANDLIGRRISEMVVPDDSKNIELTRLFIRSGYRVLHRKSYEVDVRGNPKVFINSMRGLIVEGKLVATFGWQADVTEQEAREADDCQL